LQNAFFVYKHHFINTGLQPGVGSARAGQPFQRLVRLCGKAAETALGLTVTQSLKPGANGSNFLRLQN
jgi:hypothetical protein